jgi:putative membrane protein
MTLLARWIVNAAALMLVAYLYPGVTVTSFIAALIAALVLGLVNAIIRPLLVMLTLPVTILTLGLFIFVINALLFWLVASVVDGFQVAGFGAALLGSILYSLLTLVTSWVLFSRK